MKGNKEISLFFDTSTYRLEIALVIDTKVKVISHENIKSAVEKTNLLLSRVLMSENIKLKDVDSLYTLLGPGSNTGIRIGVTICKTIYAMNHDVKLYGVNTLKIINKGNGIALLSDRAGNLFAYDDVKNESFRIKKDEINLDPTRKIYLEDLDSYSHELLSNYNPDLIIENVNVTEQMVFHKELFDDYSSKEEEFLPYYGVEL